MIVYEKLSKKLKAGHHEVLIDGYLHEYLRDLKFLFKTVAAYNKPILIQIEPDLWNQLQIYEKKTGIDASMILALIKYSDIDCGATEENIPELMKCITRLAKFQSQKIKIGFSYPKDGSTADFMVKTGVLTVTSLLPVILFRLV